MRAALLAGCLWLAAATACCAQGRSVSYSTWRVAADSVTLRFRLPAGEAQQLVGAGVPVLTSQRLGDYLLAHVSVRGAGRSCQAIDQGYDIGRVDPLAVGNDYYGFEIVFRCESMTDLVLGDSALFERVPSHLNFARVERDGRISEQLFTRARQQLRLTAGQGLPSAGIGRYLRLGVGHILDSPDRLCVLLAMLILWRCKRDVVFGVAGVGLGYALALVASALTAAEPRSNLLEAAFGLMIGVLAFASVVRQIERARSALVVAWPALLLLLALVAVARHAPASAFMLAGTALFAGSFLALIARAPARAYLQLLPAAVFGFLDGWVLPSMQAAMQLPKAVQLPMLVGFDLGAWLGAALLMLLGIGAWGVLRGRPRLLPARPLTEVVAACLAAAGSFWLLTRLQI